MRNRALLPLLIALVVVACQKAPVEKTTDTGATIVTEAPAPMEATAPATATTQTAAAAAPAGATLASQETTTGAIAEITEFRRKGNTLTAKVRFVNRGSTESKQDITYSEVYLLDTNAGKKYEVLKDEKGAYIAARVTGWDSKWWDTVEPGESRIIWMKFPAPPPEVKAITLQVPGAPPFEDVPIQD